MKISIICPVYNGEEYLQELNRHLLNQKIDSDQAIEIKYILTKSRDNSEEILKKINASYCVITPEEFSHSRVREEAAINIDTDIIVFISQDVKMKNNVWLKNLIDPIIHNECSASFSRQICKNNGIEKYIREKNYPDDSYIVGRECIPKYQLRTFFYSDASSAVDAQVYKKLRAYDGKDLIINEDMYFAHKIIYSGYKIKYCSDSEVFHSHIFKLKQLYSRYFDTGVFFKSNPYFLQYKGNSNGVELAKYVFKRACEEKNIKVLLRILPDFGARFIGKFLGQRYDKLPKRLVLWSSGNKGIYKYYCNKKF